MFYDPQLFKFYAELTHSWRKIYREYLDIRGEAIDWPETELYGSGWKVFGLYDFPTGQPIEANIRRCPLTASIVSENIDRHGAVGFSILKPNTRINAHQGYQGNFLRVHLGLQVPDGDCAIKVDNQVKGWKSGELLVFDDRVWHEAWNMTRHERVVLLVDFVPECNVHSVSRLEAEREDHSSVPLKHHEKA